MAENREFARKGGRLINDTNKKTGNWHVISFYKFSEILEITIQDAGGNDFINMAGFVGETFPPGYELYGKITAIKLANGGCIAYNDPE